VAQETEEVPGNMTGDTEMMEILPHADIWNIASDWCCSVLVSAGIELILLPVVAVFWIY